MAVIYREHPTVDHPFAGICKAVEKHAAEGAWCFQKWTCGGCGKRLMAETPNYFTLFGHCDECGHDTDIQKVGCNYTLARMVPRV